MFVLDSSVAFGFAAPDEWVSEAVAQRLAQDTVLVPAIWPFEVANAVHRGRLQRRFTAEQETDLAEVLSALDVRVDSRPLDRILNDVVPIAIDRALSVYDAAFLELALREGLPLATLDARLGRAARDAGVVVLR